MLNNFKDLAVQYVKTIVDCNRCGLCDRSDGTRMRFTCGHSACTDCVYVACECPICTPLLDASSTRPQSDVPHTERVKLANELLTTFQDAFDVDVYQRQRISEQLKVEKELFPECIQAPTKYFNKRKSLNSSSKNKENSYTFSGEGISSKREWTMNKSRSYVQDWLQKQTTPSSAPRSPFSDLPVNTHHNSPATKHITVKGKGKQDVPNQPTRQSNRKRSRLKQSLKSNSQSGLENYLTPVEKSQSKNTWISAKRLKKAFSENAKGPGKAQVRDKVDNKYCDESAIVIDDDDGFAIEDTQDQVVDKDRLALLAVANADRQQKKTSSSIVEIEDSQTVSWEKCSTPIVINEKENTTNKIPFYRKSYLFENCEQCVDNNNGKSISPELRDESSKTDTDISITVENRSFVTIITVADCHEIGSNKKQSTAVQTETEEPFLGFEHTTQKDETVKMISKIQEYIQSEAMFTEEDFSVTDSQKTKCTEVMLRNNDAESNLASREMLVDTHNENGVLTESGAGSRTRKRKAPRGVTPDSTNSSDKENCDPNRKKKYDSKKKKKAQK